MVLVAHPQTIQGIPYLPQKPPQTFVLDLFLVNYTPTDHLLLIYVLLQVVVWVLKRETRLDFVDTHAGHDFVIHEQELGDMLGFKGLSDVHRLLKLLHLIHSFFLFLVEGVFVEQNQKSWIVIYSFVDVNVAANVMGMFFPNMVELREINLQLLVTFLFRLFISHFDIIII